MATAEYTSTGRATGPRSGFWRRFGATFVDGLILGVISFVFIALLKGGGYAVGFLVAISYYTYFEGGPRGQTLGKRLLGIRVVDFSTGGPIGYGRAAVRLSPASCPRSSSTSVTCGCFGTARSSAGTRHGGELGRRARGRLPGAIDPRRSDTSP